MPLVDEVRQVMSLRMVKALLEVMEVGWGEGRVVREKG